MNSGGVFVSAKSVNNWAVKSILSAVAEAECNTVTGLKQVHHAATPLLLS